MEQPDPPARTELTNGVRPDLYRSPYNMGLFLQVGLALSVVVAFFILWTDFQYLSVVGGLLDGSYGGTFDEAVAIEDRWAAASLIDLPMVIGVGIVWLAWMHRLYRNLDAFGRSRQHHVGWAVGGWFVPIMNLFRPRQVMGDIWRKSEPDYTMSRSAGPVPAVMNVWWGAWIAIGFIERYVRGLGGDTLEQVHGIVRVLTAFDAVYLVAAGAAWVVVRNTTARQEAAAAAMT